MSHHPGVTRLNPVQILFRYDQRRLLGLLAALRLDPAAIIATTALLAGLVVGGAWALTAEPVTPPPVVVAQLGLAAGIVFGLTPRPLPALRAGPFAEFADDRRAVFLWLWIRTLAGLIALTAAIATVALLFGWRPAPDALLFLPAAVLGSGVGAALRLIWPTSPVRLSSIRLPRFAPLRGSRSRARRLGWIQLSRPVHGLPAGVSALAAWLGALLIGLADVDPRLAAVVDGASALLVFLGTVQVLRFDAATVRLLAFEPNSLLGLARDLFGARLAVAAAAGVLVALVSAPVALVGLAVGAAFRAFEFLHGLRRDTAARLLAQAEIGLVLMMGFVAGPVALAWIVIRSAWLYRRADQSMGLA